MLVTNNNRLAKRAAYLSHQAKDDAIRYIHNDVGYNFRLNNIQAAMGLAQLKSLSEVIKLKTANYRAYKELINDIKGLDLSDTPNYSRNNCWMYALRVNRGQYGLNTIDLMR